MDISVGSRGHVAPQYDGPQLAVAPHICQDPAQQNSARAVQKGVRHVASVVEQRGAREQPHEITAEAAKGYDQGSPGGLKLDRLVRPVEQEFLDVVLDGLEENEQCGEVAECCNESGGYEGLLDGQHSWRWVECALWGVGCRPRPGARVA
eukprot:CAMPEP_0173270278 /NCGR_PEP_ID=MMETSP1143-20121109/155_1 /TAXON_ID=483371 /ORGANISM="non described non described, Strain CCMP2298" /LENGTH=149 /DNA_ID=CAMNT_0014206679 /DNA_START=245 /DNA_END=690 /DNA_ORIENTATION=+